MKLSKAFTVLLLLVSIGKLLPIMHAFKPIT